MSIAPDAAARSLLPDSISAQALSRQWAQRFFLIALAALVIALFALGMAKTAMDRYHHEARLTYVKLAPNGTWNVETSAAEGVEYFEATLRQVMYDWIERRYSKRRSTILSDWGIANTMYSPELQAWFADTYRASVIAAEHAACSSCDDQVVRVRTHQHLTELPREVGAVDSEPFSTLLFADASRVPAGTVLPIDTVRKVYRVKWRFLAKASLQQRPDLLRYNPIGVQILGVEETEDTTP
jgi:hypothetical protein